MTLRELHDRRTRLLADLRNIEAAPGGQNGDLSDEQQQRFDGMKGELETLDRSIARRTWMDEQERRAEGAPLDHGDEQFGRLCRNFSLLRAVASMTPDLAARVDAGREREVSQELARRSGRPFQGLAVPMDVFLEAVHGEQRVLTTAAPVGGPGSNLIATDHMGCQFIDRLRSALVIRRLGARVLSNLVGNVDVPKLKGSATAGWFAENAAIGTSDHQFDKVTLTPKHVGARTELSRNMLLQSSPDVEQLVRADFAAILAEAVDRAVIVGGGSNEPVGLLANGDLDTTISLGTPTWEAVLQLIEAVETADSEGSAWLTNPKVVRKLRSTPKVADTDSAMIMEGRSLLADYPLATTNLVPSNLTDGGDPEALNRSALIFGRWSDVLLGYWSAFDLLVNPYETTAYSKGNVQVRGIITMDAEVRHIESFAASIDVATAPAE